MSAIVGGTAAELGGGKFANGAVTGAFIMMYNELGHLDKIFHKDISRIQESDKGAELWKKIIASKLVVNIISSDELNTMAEPILNVSGQIIGYNVRVFTGDKTSFTVSGYYNGKSVRFHISRTRALAHELGHVLGVPDHSYTSWDGLMSLVNINTWENPVMTPLDGYTRTSYGAK